MIFFIEAWTSLTTNITHAASEPEPEPEEEKESVSYPLETFYIEPCPICLEEYYGENRVGVLSCGHTFHPECIKKWLEQSKTCPYCRATDVFLAKIYDSKYDLPDSF